ncbi:MAG: BTAD domain-containing putative transcriptional regulator [Caldilineaceae bacterium]
MPHLQLNLFGQFHCALEGTVLRSFESDKVRALLLFLAVEQEQALSRSSLATLLWPDFGEEGARANLRQALYQLRQVLGEEQAETPFILTSRQTIQWNSQASSSLDVITFRRLLAKSAQHDHLHLEACEECLQQLQQAAELYLGDFLAGFAVAESEGFEEWRRIQQEQLHVQAVDLFHQLTMAFEARRDYVTAQRFGQRLLQLEPWREEAHRQLMRIYAHQGQRAAALAQYQSCRQALQQEFGIEPEAATMQLYKEILTDKFASDSSTNAIPATESAAPIAIPHNLPAQSTPFIGREQELTELLALVAKSEHRLLTLLGPGGIGKTRMALEAAQRLLADTSRYADGIFFVSLAPLATSDNLIPAIASALGIELHGADLQKALLKQLQPKQLLLVLDNFEHLLDGAGQVTEIVQQAAHVQIIVTSRARLNLHGETCYPVQPLAESATITVPDALNSDAVRLFMQSAKRSYADFVITENNLPAVLRICRLVEGMPLGLEMAASWIQWLPVAEIAKEIEKSSDFLTVDWVDKPARQRSMWAVFEWSWKLLSQQEQTIFAALSVFRGGFGHEAAAQITGATLRSLISLANKSLLLVTRLPGEPARYQIHELLRQFAAEHLLRTSAEHEQVVMRHSTFYLEYVAAREARLARNEPSEAAAEIKSEIDNVRQAWRSAIQRLDWVALHRSAWALNSFYRHTGSHTEALQAFQSIADRLPVLLEPTLIHGHSPQQILAPVSRLVAIHAYLLALQNKVDQAIAVAQSGLVWAEAEEAADAAALSHLSWAQALRLQGCQAEAQQQFAQALHLARSVKNGPGKSELLYDVECSAIMLLGAFAADWGKNHEARQQMGRSLELAQTLGKRRMQITSLINMADVARNMGAYPAARQEYEEAIRLSQQMGFRWGEGVSQLELGDVVRKQGEYSYAAKLMKNALTLLEEIGEHGKTALALTWLGRLYTYLGDTTTAKAWLTRHQQITEQVKGWESEIDYYQAQMVLALQRGELMQALAFATEGLQIGQSRSLPDVQAYALMEIGHIQRQLGQWPAAAEAYQQAFTLYTTLQRPDFATEALAGLATVAQQQGDQPQALSLVEALLKQLSEEPTAGLDEPFFSYLVCYQVLAAQHDPRAPSILQSAHHLLQRYADQIDEEDLRCSFLENVPLHRQLQQS